MTKRVILIFLNFFKVLLKLFFIPQVVIFTTTSSTVLQYYLLDVFQGFLPAAISLKFIDDGLRASILYSSGEAAWSAIIWNLNGAVFTNITFWWIEAWFNDVLLAFEGSVPEALSLRLIDDLLRTKEPLQIPFTEKKNKHHEHQKVFWSVDLFP